MKRQDFLLLQINDTAFPIGSFQHSFGLESYVLNNIIVDSKSLLNFMQSYLENVLLYNDLLALKLCFDSNIDRILEIQNLLFALSIPKEIREANYKLGVRFIKAIKSLKMPINTAWESYINKSIYPTHSTSYAVFCATYCIDYTKAVSNYLYAQSANMVINGVKLIPLSQDCGQWILKELQDTFFKIFKILKDLDLDDLGNSTPFYDILAMNHQYLYSRLYMS